MADFGKMLEGIALFLWPVVIIILIVIFRPSIVALIESAKSRKITIKIGGQELTIEEANKLQQDYMSDLQSRVIEIEKAIKNSTPQNLTVTEYIASKPTIKRLAILWVDDNPKNNSYYVQRLSDMGVKVELAFSTNEGMRKFYEGQYSLVISDMGRSEKHTYNPTAGLELLKEIREHGSPVPFIIFTTSRTVQEYASKSRTLGFTNITSSGTELFVTIENELNKVAN